MKRQRAPHAPHLRGLLGVGALFVIWATWLVAMWFSVRLVATHPYDFEVYYAAAQSLRFDHNANIYSAAVLLRTAEAHGGCVGYAHPAYIYPPLLAILLEPLTLTPCATASVAWLLINAALWAGATLLLADLLARRWPDHRLAALTLVSLLSLGFWHAFFGLFLGQVHLVLLFSLALALWLVERRQPWLAGGTLAIGAMLKFFPIVLIGYFLLRSRFRVVGGAALAGAVLLALMALGSSLATVARSLVAVLTFVRGQTIPGQNESLIVVAPYVGLALAALVGLTFVVVVLVRRGDDLLGAGFAASTMLLISPVVWSFYLVWLLPTFAACFAALGPLGRDSGWRMRAAWAALALLGVVLALPLALTLRPFATLALWTITAVLYWRSSAAEPAPLPAHVTVATTTGA